MNCDSRSEDVGLGQIDIAEDSESAADKGKSGSAKLAAAAIAVVVLTSLALAYFYTDMFVEKATIQVDSLGYPNDVQYEIHLSHTGVMLASGTLASNGSEVHKFSGFDAAVIMFRCDVLPGQDLVCPYLLSDGQVLQINIFPLGSVGWQLSY
jgi:hypothetical protein